LYVLDRFDVLMSKWFLKNKKNHWHAFRHEILFEKQPQPHCQTYSKKLEGWPVNQKRKREEKEKKRGGFQHETGAPQPTRVESLWWEHYGESNIVVEDDVTWRQLIHCPERCGSCPFTAQSNQFFEKQILYLSKY